MEFAYALVIILLAAWSMQMVFDYLRKADQIQAEIKETVASQQRVSREAEAAEEDLKELQGKLEELETRAEELKSQEKELRQQEASVKREHGR